MRRGVGNREPRILPTAGRRLLNEHCSRSSGTRRLCVSIRSARHNIRLQLRIHRRNLRGFQPQLLADDVAALGDGGGFEERDVAVAALAAEAAVGDHDARSGTTGGTPMLPATGGTPMLPATGGTPMLPVAGKMSVLPETTRSMRPLLIVADVAAGDEAVEESCDQGMRDRLAARVLL